MFFALALRQLKLKTLTQEGTCRWRVHCYEVTRELIWTNVECLKVQRAGLLHDIGKISMPDSILTKNAK